MEINPASQMLKDFILLFPSLAIFQDKIEENLHQEKYYKTQLFVLYSLFNQNEILSINQVFEALKITLQIMLEDNQLIMKESQQLNQTIQKLLQDSNVGFKSEEFEAYTKKESLKKGIYSLIPQKEKFSSKFFCRSNQSSSSEQFQTKTKEEKHESPSFDEYKDYKKGRQKQTKFKISVCTNVEVPNKQPNENQVILYQNWENNQNTHRTKKICSSKISGKLIKRAKSQDQDKKAYRQLQINIRENQVEKEDKMQIEEEDYICYLKRQERDQDYFIENSRKIFKKTSQKLMSKLLKLIQFQFYNYFYKISLQEGDLKV